MLSVLLSVLLSAVACLKTSQVTASRPRPLRLRLTFDTMSAVTPLKTSNIFHLEYHIEKLLELDSRIVDYLLVFLRPTIA